MSILFFFFFGRVGSSFLCEGFSLVVASGGHSSSRRAGFSLSWSLLLRSTGSRCAGWVVVAHGPVAPRHVGSSQTRARTRVPCISRRILNHCATREALEMIFFLNGLILRILYYNEQVKKHFKKPGDEFVYLTSLTSTSASFRIIKLFHI